MVDQMDGEVWTALVRGATAALANDAPDALKAGYSKLKALVLRRVNGESASEAAINELEKDPETWRAPVQKAIASKNMGADQDIVDAARELLELLNDLPGGDQYNVTIGTAYGVNNGPDGHVVNNCDTDPTRKPDGG